MMCPRNISTKTSSQRLDVKEAEMSQRSFSPGFRGRRQKSDLGSRLPPGQYLEQGFPVLSAGPTPHTPLTAWDFSILEGTDQRKRWNWDEFRKIGRASCRERVWV